MSETISKARLKKYQAEEKLVAEIFTKILEVVDEGYDILDEDQFSLGWLSAIKAIATHGLDVLGECEDDES